MYRWPGTVEIVKSRWSHEIRNATELWGGSDRMSTRWEDNITIDLNNTVYKDGRWMQLDQDTQCPKAGFGTRRAEPSESY